jgi:hypothetical protein
MMKTACLTHYSVKGEEGLYIQQPPSGHPIMFGYPESSSDTSLNSHISFQVILNPQIDSILVDGAR